MKKRDPKLFLYPGTQHSMGTAILFNSGIIDKKYNLDTINIHKSEDGILINLTLENREFTIINLYATNIPKERKTLFNKVAKWVLTAILFYFKQ